MKQRRVLALEKIRDRLTTLEMFDKWAIGTTIRELVQVFMDGTRKENATVLDDIENEVIRIFEVGNDN